MSDCCASNPAGGPVALVAAHGELAAGLRSAVEQITGRGALLDVLSNRDLSGAEIEAAIRERLLAAAAYVVFTDLPGGSCALAARRVQRDRPEVTVVTGTNLSTLLDFVCAAGGGCHGDVRTAEGAREVAGRAVQRGQVSLTPPPAGAVPVAVTAAAGAGAERAG